MRKIHTIVAFILSFFCITIDAHAAIAFVTDRNAGGLFYFDPNNLSVPATNIFSGLPTDNVVISPDGNTVYFTVAGPSAFQGVYSFPTQGPYTAPTLLNSSFDVPVGIAVSNDGQTLFVATDYTFGPPGPGIYSLPAGGGPITQITPIFLGTTIASPLFLVLNGDTLYVGDYLNKQIYCTPISSSSTTYDATLLQTTTGVGGLAISYDGYLYWSTAYAKDGNLVYRVPLASPTDIPTVVAIEPPFFGDTPDGLALSCDGSTCFLTFEFSGPVTPGVYSFPTNQGFPQTTTLLSSLNIPQAIDIAIGGCVFPPATLTGVQKKCDFGLVYERCNILRWSPSRSMGILYYRIYRDGLEIATVSASTFSYKDHDRKKGVKTLYSVTSVNQSGVESFPINVTIQ